MDTDLLTHSAEVTVSGQGDYIDTEASVVKSETLHCEINFISILNTGDPSIKKISTKLNRNFKAATF